MAVACEVVLQDGAGTPPELVGELSEWLIALLASLAPEAASFGARLAEDEEVREWNGRLRGRDRATDVLSFPGERTPDGLHLGDVVIAVPVARRQAAEAGHSLSRELKELLLHGVLHCLGHDHENDEGEMAALELELRERWVLGG